MMEKLIYYQRLQLRDKICQIKVDDLTDIENLELQGRILYKLGFNEIQSEYPSDTYVGVHRREGWEVAKSDYEESITLD